MTEADWQNHEKVYQMLEWLQAQGRASERKLRLFAVACFARVRHLCTDPRGQQAVEVAERYADGAAAKYELQAAWRDTAGDDLRDETSEQGCALAALFTARQSCDPRRRWIHRAATAATDAVFYGTMATTDDEELAYQQEAAESLALCRLLRDIFGNPFRPPPPVAPSLLTWTEDLVPRLADQVYEHRLLPSGHLDPQRLAVLADALEEAGADAELVAHLRGPGPHVRGCWAVDLLLRKE